MECGGNRWDDDAWPGGICLQRNGCRCSVHQFSQRRKMGVGYLSSISFMIASAVCNSNSSIDGGPDVGKKFSLVKVVGFSLGYIKLK